ncbi:glutamine-rich protein 2 [Pyxicephalus adspersus]|uniref:glutamine-rich protein 2 n=1 Tax=Pyxicephalus adspersus TaxID=30357 RepID=UPI003B59D299
MATAISLSDLVNLSIGTPEIGAVNFNALRTLLHAIIKHLNIQDIKAEILEEDNGPYNLPRGLLKVDQEGQNEKVPNGYRWMEQKVLKLEQEFQALNGLPTASDLMGRVKSQNGGSTPVEDMWCMMQMKKRLEANEDGVHQAMAVLQDLLHEISVLKDSQQELNSQLTNVAENIQQDNMHDNMQELEQQLALMEMKTATKGEVENLQIGHQSTQKKLKDLEEKLAKFPSPDELSNMVQWDILRETLVRRPVTVDAQTSYNLLIGHDNKTSLVGKMTSQTMLQEPTASDSMFQAQVESAQITEVFKPDGLVHTTVQTTISLAPEAVGDSSISASEELIQANGQEDTSIPSQAVVTRQSLEDQLHVDHRGPDPEDALTSIPNVSQEHVHPPSSPGDEYSSPTTMWVDGTTQIPVLHPSTAAHLRILGDSNQSSPILASNPGTPNKATPPLTPSSSQGGRTSHRYADTVAALRNIGDLSEEHALLRTRVEELEKIKADRTELNMLQSTTEKHMKNMSDLQEKLSSLYKDMQELKSNKEKDKNLLQDKVLQLQKELEQLDKTTSSLFQEQREQQGHINIIYQTLEKLEENKADKEHVELKQADMRALEGKVSRSQFDATTEQINNMMQELLGKVSGQEQDWQKVLEKINLEMQSKLDRMELDPLKNKLEERWKEIRRQLQEKPPQYESDDAAGIRRQLFHCLSCDRPLDMMVPGPPILTIPNIPGLPSHRSNRPFTVYELDQIRQCNRSDRIADLNDLGYTSNNRSCGGSHTLTFPYRRYVRMQGITPCASQDKDLIGVDLKEEINILGSDGHIYHGRMDCSLPAIHVKVGKSKRVKPLQGSQKSLLTSDVSVPPTRPQSAKSIVSYRKPVLDAQITSLT